MKSLQEEIKELEKNIAEVFTKEDIEFNRKMVRREKELKSRVSARKPKAYSTNCGFVSEIINEFRRKWGIEQGD